LKLGLIFHKAKAFVAIMAKLSNRITTIMRSVFSGDVRLLNRIRP